MNVHKHFSKRQKKEAKAKHKAFKLGSPEAWRYQRDEFLKVILSYKKPVKFDLAGITISR